MTAQYQLTKNIPPAYSDDYRCSLGILCHNPYQTPTEATIPLFPGGAVTGKPKG